MKKIIAFTAVLALFFTLSGCKKSKEDLVFYVVPGEAVTASMVDNSLLTTAKMKGRVAYTGEDLSGWLWEEHRVQLKDVAVTGGQTNGGSALFQADAGDIFVLAVGDRVIYAGGFAPATGSVKAIRNPYIQDGESDTFYLLCDQKYAQGEDPRVNTYLYDYLADQNLLVSTLENK